MKLIAVATALVMLAGLGCSPGDESASKEVSSTESPPPTESARPTGPTTAQSTPSPQAESGDAAPIGDSPTQTPSNEVPAPTASDPEAPPVTEPSTPTAQVKSAGATPIGDSSSQTVLVESPTPTASDPEAPPVTAPSTPTAQVKSADATPIRDSSSQTASAESPTPTASDPPATPTPAPSTPAARVAGSDTTSDKSTSDPATPVESPSPAVSESTPTVESQRDASQIVQLQPGQVYQGGTVVGVSQLGVSFVIPDGWAGGIPQGADAAILRSDTRAGMVMALGQMSASPEEVVAALSQPVPLDASTFLMPDSQPVQEGQWIGVRYADTDGVNVLVGYAMALVDPEQRGILYVVAGPAGEADYFLKLIGQLVATTESASVAAQADTAPPEELGGATSPAALEWKDYLAGQKMTFLHTFGSGGEGTVSSSAKRELYLCRDGRFSYQEESSVSVDVRGSGGFDAGGDGGSGQWRIIAKGDVVGIELVWRSGETTAHQLGYTDGATYVDGERWFVTDDNPYC